MPLPIAAVLFDYGNVLCGPPHPPAWQRMLAITGLDEPVYEAAYWTPRPAYDRGLHTAATYFQAVGALAQTPLNFQQIANLIAADTELWTQVNQPMLDFALRLQAAGTRTGILSNLGDDMTAGALARLPWLAGFHHRLWSHTLQLAKPEPAIYQASVSGLGVPAGHILFVDDREDNLAGAQAAGLQTIRYTDHATFVGEIAARNLSEFWRTGVP